MELFMFYNYALLSVMFTLLFVMIVDKFLFAPKRYHVLGKAPHTLHKNQYQWVIGERGGVPLAQGNSTVYHWLNGERCHTLVEREFANLVTQAEMREAAGKPYKIYTWKELMGGKQDDK